MPKTRKWKKSGLSGAMLSMLGKPSKKIKTKKLNNFYFRGGGGEKMNKILMDF